MTPHSTYRLQLTADFPLQAAVRWLDYVHRLGADWVYCSPLLQSEPGSQHGYDVIDHARTDTARGGRAGLAALADAAHRRGMGVLVDIVPNHVGIATPLVSVWWCDVLTSGPDSARASAFDIDWEAGGGKIRIPVLGDGPDELATLQVRGERLCYYDHEYPLARGTAGPGDPARTVHDRQHYELVHFRRANTDLNYRRFFAVSTLAGIRVEDPDVFDASHAEIASWIDAGWVDGLRVDHPDGLADPGEYLARLSDLAGGRYVLVEKILEPGEDLPAGWACAGTTGYETLAAIDQVLVDPRGHAPLRALHERLAGTPPDWPALTHRTKRAVADGILGSEVRRLARLLHGALPFDRAVDAVAELLACYPVYRTYLPLGADHLATAHERAARHRPDLADALRVVVGHAERATGEFGRRLQQTSGSVMAKGVEDCAFYRYPVLTSLTEVGGDPSTFAMAVDEFHAAQERRLGAWPDGMTTLSTHDTKRGEDVRARIDVLAEVPDDWARVVTGWLTRTAFPDPVLGNLLLQTAVGAWPIEPDRLHAYAEKAAREAGDSTRWIDPDTAFEDALHELVDACYHDPVISAELTAFADRIRPAGWSNSLSAKLIQLTLPGVPDVYRGTELWQNSLVDPDNRAPFDALAPGGAAELLDRLDDGYLPPVDESGAAKLLVTSRALRARRDHTDLFTGYRPLAATGAAAEHLLGFDRGGAVTLATRLPIRLAAAGGWRGTTVTLPPGRWRDGITGTSVADHAGDAALAEVFARYPVALLLPG